MMTEEDSQANVLLTTRPPTEQQPRLDGVFGGTELHRLARRCEWTVLLASFDLETAKILNEHFRTPLHYAMEQGNAPDDVVLELIRIAPFQIRVKDVSGNTPFHLGCRFGMGLAVLEFVLEMDDVLTGGHDNQSVVTMPNNDNKTPLQIFNVSRRMSGLVKRILDTEWSCNFWKHHREEFLPVLLTLTAATPLEEGENDSEGGSADGQNLQNRLSQSRRQLSSRLSQVVILVKEQQRQQQQQ